MCCLYSDPVVHTINPSPAPVRSTSGQRTTAVVFFQMGHFATSPHSQFLYIHRLALPSPLDPCLVFAAVDPGVASMPQYTHYLDPPSINILLTAERLHLTVHWTPFRGCPAPNNNNQPPKSSLGGYPDIFERIPFSRPGITVSDPLWILFISSLPLHSFPCYV